MKKQSPVKRKVQKKKTTKKVKSSSALNTLIATAVAGVIIILIMAVLMYQLMVGKQKKQATEEPVNKDTQTEMIDRNQDLAKMDGVIKEISYTDGTIGVKDISKDETIQLNIKDYTPIKDQYGKPMVLKELTQGDIVNVSYNKKNNEPQLLRLSSNAWKFDTDGIRFEPSEQKIYRGATAYTYDEQDLVIVDRGGQFTMDELTEQDQVIIKGYGNKLYSIELITGHGFIQLMNYDRFIDAVISLDRNKSIIVKDKMLPIPVKEGEHTIMLEKVGYEDYIEKVFVLSKETAIIDLKDFQIKKGILDFASNRQDVIVYISNTTGFESRVTVDEKVTLDFGKYKIQVLDGEEVLIEDEVEMNQETVTFNMNFNVDDTNGDSNGDEEARNVSISTASFGAKIFIDNKFLGYSPLETELNPGDYKVLFMMDGYNNSNYDIHIEKGEDILTFTFPALSKKTATGSQSESGTSKPVIKPTTPVPTDSGQDTPNGGDSTTPGEDVYQPY